MATNDKTVSIVWIGSFCAYNATDKNVKKRYEWAVKYKNYPIGYYQSQLSKKQYKFTFEEFISAVTSYYEKAANLHNLSAKQNHDSKLTDALKKALYATIWRVEQVNKGISQNGLSQENYKIFQNYLKEIIPNCHYGTKTAKDKKYLNSELGVEYGIQTRTLIDWAITHPLEFMGGMQDYDYYLKNVRQQEAAAGTAAAKSLTGNNTILFIFIALIVLVLFIL